MKEVRGDIWDYHDKGHWIVITTNGTVKSNGEAVMGRGVALQAKQEYPELPAILGRRLQMEGNIPYLFSTCRIVTFPVKHNWWERADVKLIEESCLKLRSLLSGGASEGYFLDELYMVRPGCGSGGLDWKDVKPILEKYLDDRFIVVER